MAEESDSLEKQLQALVQRHLDRLAETHLGSLQKSDIQKKYSKLAVVSDFAIDVLCQQPECWHTLDASETPSLELSSEDDSQWPRQVRRWRRLQSARVIWRDLHEVDNVEASLFTISEMADIVLSSSIIFRIRF